MKSIMDGTVNSVQDRCTTAVNHLQLIELLKEIEDSGFFFSGISAFIYLFRMLHF